MRLPIFFLPFIFCFSFLIADDFQQMRQAELSYNVKEYSRARDIFQNLLQQNLPSWKRAIIMYNLGLTQLEDKKWDQALTAFHAISLNNPLKPLLEYNIKKSIMLLNIRKGEYLNDLSSPELFRQAISEADAAQKSYCSLQLAEGETDCQISPEIQKLKEIALYDLANSLKTSIDFHISKITLKDGLPWLQKGITSLSEDIEFLKKKFGQEYLNLFLSDAQSWFPLWSALNKLIKANKKDPEIKKRLALLDSASDLFQKALDQVKKNAFEEAQQSFEASEKLLKELMQLPPPPAISEEQSDEKKESQMQNQKTRAYDKLKQQLLEMEQADESTTAPTPVQKQVERPW